jgi:hypothetical protein
MSLPGRLQTLAASVCRHSIKTPDVRIGLIDPGIEQGLFPTHGGRAGPGVDLFGPHNNLSTGRTDEINGASTALNTRLPRSLPAVSQELPVVKRRLSGRCTPDTGQPSSCPRTGLGRGKQTPALASSERQE